MARKLKTYVHVVERDDKGNQTNSGTFGPDDDLSKPENSWVEKAITNSDVWKDDPSDDSDGKQGSTSSPEPEPDPIPGPVPTPTGRSRRGPNT